MALTNVATLLIRCRQYAEGSQLLAAAEAIQPTVWASIDPDERTAGEAALAAARTALGETAFTACEAAGRDVPMARAIDDALTALA